MARNPASTRTFTGVMNLKQRCAVVIGGSSGIGKARAPIHGRAPQGIVVNGVSPGVILKPMNRSALDDVEERGRKEAAFPRRRVGTAEDGTDPVVFLHSDAGDTITGTPVTIDGGLSLVTAHGA